MAPLPFSRITPDMLSQVPSFLMPQQATPAQAAPPSMSLLSPDDLKAARRRGLLGFSASMLSDNGSTANALGRALAAGVGTYDAAKQNLTAEKVQNMQFGDAQKFQQVRQQIAQQFPGSPTESTEQTISRLEKIFAALVSAGDTEGAGKIGEVLKSYGGNRSAQPKAPSWEDFGGKKVLIDSNTGRPVLGPDGKPVEMMKTPNARDPNAPDTAAQLREQRQFQREQQLADDYNKDTKDVRGAARDISGAISEAPRALAGDGSAQVNMLYAFVKAMDPGSVVREGEVALARMAAPFWQQAQAMLNKYMSGEAVVVPPGMVKKMAELLQRRLNGYDRFVRERSSYYASRAKKWGVSEDNFPLLDLPRVSTSAAGASDLAARHGAPPK